MNHNSLLGLIGVALLVFVVAFAVGRWTIPTRIRSAAAPIGTGPAPESLAVIESESTRLLTAAQTEAYENELAPPPVSRPASQPASSRKPRPRGQSAAAAAATTAPDTATTTVAQTATSDTGAAPAVATESIAPKTVLAKDYVAIEERQNYAAQLPKELLEKGVEAKVNVVGELAEVIILSSPAFDARSKDTVIKQVCIDLKTLGFKRVHITDGGDYTMHFGL